MLTKILPLLVAVIVFGFTTVAKGQTESQPSTMTQYEKFLKRTDVVIVTQSYPLPNLPGGGGFKMSANVASALGESKKAYGVDIAGRTIDFDQLASIQDGLDKMIRTANSLNVPNASSVSYKSPFGLSANYYTYTDGSEQPKWNLHLVAGMYTYQAANLDMLKGFRDLIAQARQKLVSLGAR